MSTNNFEQILQALQEPFPSEYVEWKPQSVSKDGKRAIAAAYVDARRYQERLDLVCPGWSSHIELLANGQVAKVAITIEGVTREDVGEASAEDANTVTTAVAQAFKRACAAFGLGRYLYFLPLTWCDYDPDKKRILNPPQLPDWALSEEERKAKATRAATERVRAEEPHLDTPAPSEAELLAKLGFPPESSPTAASPSAPSVTNSGAEGELADPGAYKLTFGKHSGKTLGELWAGGPVSQGYVRWLASTDGKGFQPRNHTDQVAQRMARALLSLQAAYAG